MHGALNYRVMAIFCPEYKKWLRNMKLQCLKLFIMTKTKNEFLEDFPEVSLVGSLKKCRKTQQQQYKDLRKFYRPVCFSRNWKLRHIKLLYYRLYFMVVKLCLSPLERSIDWGCSRIKCLGRYLVLRKTKLQENGESYVMLSYSYMHCIVFFV